MTHKNTDTNVMSAIKKLEVQLKQQGNELAALKMLLTKQEQVPRKLEIPRVRYGTSYSYLDSRGEVNNAIDAGGGYRHDYGNHFLTEAEASYFARRWKARQRYERLAAVENNGRLYEFSYDKENFYIVYDHWDDNFEVTYSRINQGPMVYFPTRKAAERVLAALSAEEKHILFGAPMEASSGASDAEDVK